MLTRFHKILIVVLALQLGLVVVMLTRGDEYAAEKPHPILAGFDAAKVTRLQVFANGKPKAAVDLQKHGSSWVVASAYDYPVAASKVNDALTPLAKASAAAPITTEASREKQLRVADTDFARKLVITMGGKNVTVFIGSSAGVRRAAMRIGPGSRVYAVSGVSAYAFGNQARSWVDTSYVSIPHDKIGKVTIQHGDTTTDLARSGTTWTASIGGAPIALANGESLDVTKIAQLVDKVASIGLMAPGDPKRDASHPTATITIDRTPTKPPATPGAGSGSQSSSLMAAAAAGASAPTILDVVADGDKYWVHQRGLDHAVEVNKTALDDVVEVTRDKLVKKAAPATAAKAGSGAPAKPGAKPAGGAAVKPTHAGAAAHQARSAGPAKRPHATAAKAAAASRAPHASATPKKK